MSTQRPATSSHSDHSAASNGAQSPTEPGDRPAHSQEDRLSGAARKTLDWLLIGTFCLGLLVPLGLTHTQSESQLEKRKLAPLPSWQWKRATIKQFPAQFQAFFQDHFGLRGNLVQLHARVEYGIRSASHPKVIVGKQDWLFYINPQDGNSLEDYRHNDPLTAAELQKWKQALEARYAFLKQRGIDYLFIVAPDKHTIYPEYYSDAISKLGDQSRLDQLMAHMQGSPVPILDLRQPLLQYKAQNSGSLLYFKGDTHWNTFGAAIAHTSIIQRLSSKYPKLQPIRHRPTDFTWHHSHFGDLATMLNLEEQLQDKQVPRLKQTEFDCTKEDMANTVSPTPPSFPSFMTSCVGKSQRVLIIHDSFFMFLQPYISPYFSNSFYIWQRLDPEMLGKAVQEYKPQIVLEETVERNLKMILPPPAQGNQTKLKSQTDQKSSSSNREYYPWQT
jgi:alginate O-acetyltransferase complex protein AlgJ